MNRQVLMMLSCGLLLVASSSPAWARKWSDNTGQHSVEAELVANQGDRVTLRKRDGSVVVVPVARLSEADRRYLQSLRKPAPRQSTTDVRAEGGSAAAASGPKASGKIRGRDFTPERAELANGTLTLRQGKDFFPDLAVKIFLFLDEGETLDGKSYNVTSKRRFGTQSPHIHMRWKEPGEGMPQTKIFMDGYVMKLNFGRSSKGKLPGKIDLRLPGKPQSFVAGTFTIVLPGETTEPGTGEISGEIVVPTSRGSFDIQVGCLGRNPEGKLEGPATGFKLGGGTSSATCTTWKPRNSSLSWNKKTKRLVHKHVNRPLGHYLVYVRGNRRVMTDNAIIYEGYFDWKWVEIKEDQLNVTVDFSIDPANLGTVEVVVRGATKESSVTYLPLDEGGHLPFPEAHRYVQRVSSAKLEGGKAVIRGLREGKYQIAMGPWQRGTRLPGVKVNVEVKRGSTTRVELTAPPAPS